MVTNNVWQDKIEEPTKQGQGRVLYAGFLTAQGRVLHDVFIWPNYAAGEHLPHGGGFLIDVDADGADALVRHIRRHKLRSKLECTLLDPEEWTVCASYDDGSDSALAGYPEWAFSSEADQSTESPRSVLTYPARDPREAGLGFRFIIQTKELYSRNNEKKTFVPEDAYRLRRYAFGIPEGSSEVVREQALPLEANMDVMNGVDFRKGCYVGQELTIRTKHRGVVRKRILPCVLYEAAKAEAGDGMPAEWGYSPKVDLAASVPAGAKINRLGGSSKRAAGQWLAGVGNVGLALCRVEAMTDLKLPGEFAMAEGSGFQPDHEFVVAETMTAAGEGGEEKKSGKEIRVKAFVPSWLRGKLEEQQQHSSGRRE